MPIEALEHVHDWYADQIAELTPVTLLCACCAQARPLECIRTALGPQLLCGTCAHIVSER